MARYSFDLTVTGFNAGTTGGSVRCILENGSANESLAVAVDSSSGNLLLTVNTPLEEDFSGPEKVWFVVSTFDSPTVVNDAKAIGPYVVSDVGTVI